MTASIRHALRTDTVCEVSQVMGSTECALFAARLQKQSHRIPEPGTFGGDFYHFVRIEAPDVDPSTVTPTPTHTALRTSI